MMAEDSPAWFTCNDRAVVSNIPKVVNVLRSRTQIARIHPMTSHTRTGRAERRVVVGPVD
jgi:hypothetical protein